MDNVDVDSNVHETKRSVFHHCVHSFTYTLTHALPKHPDHSIYPARLRLRPADI